MKKTILSLLLAIGFIAQAYGESSWTTRTEDSGFAMASVLDNDNRYRIALMCSEDPGKFTFAMVLNQLEIVGFDTVVKTNNRVWADMMVSTEERISHYEFELEDANQFMDGILLGTIDENGRQIKQFLQGYQFSLKIQGDQATYIKAHFSLSKSSRAIKALKASCKKLHQQ